MSDSSVVEDRPKSKRVGALRGLVPFLWPYRGMAGLALWFRGPAVATPPRWKIAVVTWLGICPTVYLLFLLLWDWIAGWWLLPRVVLLTMLVVAVMTWIVAPQLTRVFRSWLSPLPSRPPDADSTA